MLVALLNSIATPNRWYIHFEDAADEGHLKGCESETLAPKHRVSDHETADGAKMGTLDQLKSR